MKTNKILIAILLVLFLFELSVLCQQYHMKKYENFSNVVWVGKTPYWGKKPYWKSSQWKTYYKSGYPIRNSMYNGYNGKYYKPYYGRSVSPYGYYNGTDYL
jgi:hypothetical protein